MPQSATFTPFNVLIPAVSHFAVLGLGPKKKQRKLCKVLKTEILTFKKRVSPA